MTDVIYKSSVFTLKVFFGFLNLPIHTLLFILNSVIPHLTHLKCFTIYLTKYNNSELLRAVPFKYTWERGMSFLSDPPPHQ